MIVQFVAIIILIGLGAFSLCVAVTLSKWSKEMQMSKYVIIGIWVIFVIMSMLCFKSACDVFIL
jgi:hypothetical protein